MSIQINDERILKFYEKYPNLDITQVNLSIIDMFESILNNVNGVIDNSTLVEMMKRMEHVASTNEKTLQHVTNIQDLNKLSNERQTSEISHIQTILQQMNEGVMENMKHLKADMSRSVVEQLSDTQWSPESIQKITSTFEQQFNGYMDRTKVFYMEQFPPLFEHSQRPLLQHMRDTEERMNNSLSDIREKTAVHHEHTIELKQSVHDHLLHSKTSSRKGDMSENKLLPVLSEVFPTDEIIHNGSGKLSHCCDYTVRTSPKHILIENKDYNVNLGPDNVRKFLDDIERNNAHGIFLSQQSGITGKHNYKIDIHKGNVLVYLHNVNYDAGKIRAAVEIIRQLSERLVEMDLDENSISKDDLETINMEFNQFIESKENLIKMVNDFQKRMVLSVKQLNLTCLEKYLGTKFASMKSFDFVCEYCKKGWDSRRALAAHRKGCMKLYQEKKETECITVADA